MAGKVTAGNHCLYVTDLSGLIIFETEMNIRSTLHFYVLLSAGLKAVSYTHLTLPTILRV